MKLLILLFFGLGLHFTALCQKLDGKSEIIDDEVILNQSDSLSFVADTLVIGPKSHLKIEGVIKVFSPFIVIDSTARIEGGGKILIMQHFFVQKPTILDGNNNLRTSIHIEIANTNNLILGELSHSYLGAGNLKSNNFFNEKTISLMEDGVCIDLNGNKLSLGKNAILEHCSSKRMVISGNNPNSVLSKKFLPKSTFSYPIGLAEGDFSPAIISPDRECEYFVGLLRASFKSKDLQFSEKGGGIDRIWSVYADNVVRATCIFEHNTQSAEKDPYNSEHFEIYQYSDSQVWKLLTTSYLGDHRHSMNSLPSMYSNISLNYFSKFAKVRNGPQLYDDIVSVKVDRSIFIPVLGNDLAGDSRLIIKSLHVLDLPKNGVVEVLPDGQVNYKPNSGFTGSDLFVYEIEDEGGIKAKATVYITVEGEGLFISSNVVTPNGDGYNDFLVFVAKEDFVHLELKILNRWGDRLYESQNYKNTWDGNSLSGGTYYYILRANRKSGESINLKGWILLNK